MALSTFPKNFTDGSLTLKDGTGTPLTHTLTYDNGDFSISGLNGATLNADSIYESRGRFKMARKGARVYPQITFSGMMREFTNAAGTLTDFLFQTGAAYSAAVSTLGANADVFAFDIVLTIEGTNLGDAADSTLTCTDCILNEFTFSEGDPNSFSITCTVLGDITGIATQLA